MGRGPAKCLCGATLPIWQASIECQRWLSAWISSNFLARFRNPFGALRLANLLIFSALAVIFADCIWTATPGRCCP